MWYFESTMQNNDKKHSGHDMLSEMRKSSSGNNMRVGKARSTMKGLDHSSMGHAMARAATPSGGMDMKTSAHYHHDMAADFRRRFWVCLALTIPILALSPAIQGWLGFGYALKFTGDSYVQWAFSTVICLSRSLRFMMPVSPGPATTKLSFWTAIAP